MNSKLCVAFYSYDCNVLERRAHSIHESFNVRAQCVFHAVSKLVFNRKPRKRLFDDSFVNGRIITFARHVFLEDNIHDEKFSNEFPRLKPRRLQRRPYIYDFLFLRDVGPRFIRPTASAAKVFNTVFYSCSDNYLTSFPRLFADFTRVRCA